MYISNIGVSFEKKLSSSDWLVIIIVEPVVRKKNLFLLNSRNLSV